MTSDVQIGPDRARHWDDWERKAAAEGLGLSPASALRDSLSVVWEASDYVTQSCLRNPRLLVELDVSGDLLRRYAESEYRNRLTSKLDGADDRPSLMCVLREFRRYEMVRVIWRDLAGLAPIEEIMADLSAMADACIGLASDRLYQWACAEYGCPRNPGGEPQPLVVLGMGKLGAGELNLSSDVDLIFAFPEEGQTDAARPLDNGQFFARVAQRIVQALEALTPQGFVFRVDARLRPYGSAGPLAMGFDAMEEYYQSQAREWERYAMIKARPVAGDPEAGARLMEMLRPFVYRRYIDFGAIESLREMKELIGRELKRKGLVDNIKLGPGGIREIEFIGQAFQLIRGGREVDLQVRPILQVLRRLGDKGYLSADAVGELSEAYRFLRRVENRIQAWADQQTHVLPRDDAARLRLARAMGFEDWDGLDVALSAHRKAVQGRFDELFAAPRGEGQTEGAESQLGRVWRGEVGDKLGRDLLERHGYGDGDVVLSQLRQFREGRHCQALGARGRDRLGQLMPLLLETVGRLESPGEALGRLIGILEAIVRRTAYLALLVENPTALSQLVRLSSVSPWINRLLTRYPLLLDELLDPRRLYSPLHRGGLEEELESLLSHIDPEDLEQQMERLRQFAQSNILRVASADITGAIPLMVVSDYLTNIAEVVLERVVDLAWKHMVRRHGRPTQVVGDTSGFAVIGYGKLGGIELGYGSDLDLVFLHGSRELSASTEGPQPVGNDVFYARLGRRIIHFLNTQTPSGVLYEVDMRLRPNGSSGMLVSSLAAFSSYQHEDAWTWEHQALVRARPVAGDPAVRRRFDEIRRAVLSRERDPEKLRNEVREMRERMRRELDKTGNGKFDLKQGRGGIADIEFMVQFLVLRSSNAFPGLLDFTDNIRLLEGLARHGRLDGSTAERLADAFRAFRAANHRNALKDAPGLVADSALGEERRLVEKTWHTLMESPAQ